MPIITYKNGLVIDNNLNEFINLEDKDVFNFGWGNIDKKFLNDIDTDLYMKDLAKKYTNRFADYSDKFGLKCLREEVIRFLKKTYAIDSNFDYNNIIITNGSTNAITLITHYLSLPHMKAVLSQEPTYDTALNIFRSFKLDLFSVEPNMEIESVEKILQKKSEKIGFAYFITIMHNPTGISLNENKRHELLQLLKKYNLYIVEDDAYGLFSFNRHPYKLFEEYLKYVYIGSFSKYIFPALRIGYIFSPNKELISCIASLQKYHNSSPNVISQYFLYEYLSHNQTNILRNIEKRDQLLERKRVLVENELLNIRGIKYEKPAGGFYYWLILKKGIDERLIFRDLIKEGVFLIPGIIYFWDKKNCNQFRLSISSIDELRITEGLYKIRKIVEKYYN